MALHLDNIPTGLKQCPQWIFWKLAERDGKTTKIPIDIHGIPASTTNPCTWSTFEDVQAAGIVGSGIGFVFTRSCNITGIDLDHCRDPATGIIDPWALKILSQMNSYSEISPSGEGVHIIINGGLPIGIDGKKKTFRGEGFRPNAAIEIYSTGRYFTVTGEKLDNYSLIVEDRQSELLSLFSKYFENSKHMDADECSTDAEGDSKLTDEQLIARMFSSSNGGDIEALFKGDKSKYGGDDSAADMAFCNYLSFWTGKDMQQMDRIFRISKLMRPKWDEKHGSQTYGEMTIKEAIKSTTEIYEPPLLSENSCPITEEELNAYSLPEGPRFKCCLPPDHFIQQYITYGSDISDAYPDYWFAGALFALSVVADKKLKIELRQGTLYPNLYIFMAGKSSLARKSTAIDKTEDMLSKTLPDILSTYVPTEFSAEAFTEHMSDHNHAPWIRDEAAGVLSLMKKDYMRGFKDSLMQLYDSKPFRRKLRTSQRTSAKTEFNVDDPYLNVFFATTGASLGTNTELNDTLSGFLARFLFFFPQGKKDNWMPLEEGTVETSIFEKGVYEQFRSIAEKINAIPECTPIHFSPEAAKFYTEWQRDREEHWTASSDESCMQIYSRLAPAVAKLALLFELGSPDFDVQKPIRLDFIKEACRLVDEYLMITAKSVYDLVGTNAEKNVIDRIVAYLKSHGGKATRRDILGYIKIKRREFEEYISTMVEGGIVEIITVKRKGKGRDTVWVILINQPS